MVDDALEVAKALFGVCAIVAMPFFVEAMVQGLAGHVYGTGLGLWAALSIHAYANGIQQNYRQKSDFADGIEVHLKQMILFNGIGIFLALIVSEELAHVLAYLIGFAMPIRIFAAAVLETSCDEEMATTHRRGRERVREVRELLKSVERRREMKPSKPKKAELEAVPQEKDTQQAPIEKQVPSNMEVEPRVIPYRRRFG